MRSPVTRRFVVGPLIALFGLLACGDAPQQDSPFSIDRGAEDGYVHSGPTPCPECTVHPSIWTPTLAVGAFPEHLAFYGDAESSDNVEPKTVTVRNSTTSTILISDIFLVDDAASTGGENGAAFFDFDTPDLDQPLGSGDEIEVVVSFHSSSVQRSAILVVQTTHQSYTSLAVQLEGKYFFW